MGFPENERGIFDDYLEDGLQQTFAGTLNHLASAGVPSPEAVLQIAGFGVRDEAGQRRAAAVSQTRSALGALLRAERLVGGLAPDVSTNLGLLRIANAHVKANEWSLARESFAALRNRASHLEVPDFPSFVDAFRPDGATLITRDAGLASVPGSHARVRVLT